MKIIANGIPMPPIYPKIKKTINLPKPSTMLKCTHITGDILKKSVQNIPNAIAHTIANANKFSIIFFDILSPIFFKRPAFKLSYP